MFLKAKIKTVGINILLFIMTAVELPAQSIPNKLVESGKILVELVNIFKKNPLPYSQDGKAINSSDLCFTNSTTENLLIEISKKINDSSYKLLPASICLNSNAHECLMELSSTIYHYKVYKKQNMAQVLLLEGELRLIPNEKMERQIK